MMARQSFLVERSRTKLRSILILSKGKDPNSPACVSGAEIIHRNAHTERTQLLQHGGIRKFDRRADLLAIPNSRRSADKPDLHESASITASYKLGVLNCTG